MFDDLIKQLLEDALMTAATAGAGLVVTWLVAMVKKAHYDVGAQREAKLKYTVQGVILRIEEWAASRVKAKLPVSAGDKLQRAIDDLQSRTNLDATAAADKIHEVLPQLGLGARAAQSEVALVPLAPAPAGSL